MTPETTLIATLLEERRRRADADRLARAARCCTTPSLRDRLSGIAR